MKDDEVIIPDSELIRHLVILGLKPWFWRKLAVDRTLLNITLKLARERLLPTASVIIVDYENPWEELFFKTINSTLYINSINFPCHFKGLGRTYREVALIESAAGIPKDFRFANIFELAGYLDIFRDSGEKAVIALNSSYKKRHPAFIKSKKGVKAVLVKRGWRGWMKNSRFLIVREN